MSEITHTVILALIDQSRPNKKVYIQQRGTTKNLPGTYEPIQETVKLEDHPEGSEKYKSHSQFQAYMNCARRGCQEEASITPEDLEFITLIAATPENLYHQAAIIVGYTSKAPTPNPDEAEVKESYFRPLEEVRALNPKHPALSHILPLLEERLQ